MCLAPGRVYSALTGGAARCRYQRRCRSLAGGGLDVLSALAVRVGWTERTGRGNRTGWDRWDNRTSSGDRCYNKGRLACRGERKRLNEKLGGVEETEEAGPESGRHLTRSSVGALHGHLTFVVLGVSCHRGNQRPLHTGLGRQLSAVWA